MRLLITGQEGFTGRHLTHAAQAHGYEVYGLHANLCDAAGLHRELFEINPSHVIHLAAISAVTHDDYSELYQSNLLGSLNLLEGLARLSKPPSSILLASSAYVYGPQSAPILSEDLCVHPQNHYAISKYAMECLASTYRDRLAIAIVRPFNYTGVGHDDRFVIPKIVQHVARHAPEIELGDLTALREYNDVRDVVEIYCQLLRAAKPGEIYNLASGRSVSVQMVLEHLERLSGRPLLVKQNPHFLRKQETAALVGDPTKLTRTVGTIQWRSLDDTLQWMMNAAT